MGNSQGVRVNQVVSKPVVKKQQIRWCESGAQHLLQVRTKVLRRLRRLDRNALQKALETNRRRASSAPAGIGIASEAGNIFDAVNQVASRSRRVWGIGSCSGDFGGLSLIGIPRVRERGSCKKTFIPSLVFKLVRAERFPRTDYPV
jgi:hypothetical protein